jgi:thymidylate synthase
MYVFQGEHADDAWREAVVTLRASQRPEQPSRAGVTRELLGASFVIHNPRERWVAVRQPALSVPFAIVEVIGIINGRRDARYLNYFNPALPRFAGESSEYHGAYGYRLRSNFGYDQIQRAFLALRSNPESRQVVLQMWDPTIDAPGDSGAPAAPDIPCNVCSLLKIRDGRLYWTQLARSNDLFRGVPYNIVQFTSLQEVMAGWLGCELGTYTHISDSLHLYEDTLDHAYSYSELCAPSNSDNLMLSKDEADVCWRELNKRVDGMIETDVSATALDKLARMEGFPEPIQNLSKIVGADSARRHGYGEVAAELGRSCSNPLLGLLWTRWEERKGRPVGPAVSEKSASK